MQTPAPAQPTPAPVLRAMPAPSVTTVGADGKTLTLPIPTTSAQVADLLARMQVLEAQLSTVSDERHDLSDELQGTGGATARTGIQDRINLLDKQILQLETELATTRTQLASAPAELVASTSILGRSSRDDFAQGATVGGVSALFLCAVVFALARKNVRRFRRGSTSPRLDNDTVQRLQRLENGMDAIAIEIERVSEGQRFVTRLLSESQPPLGAPQQRGAVMSENPPKR
ncbi:MAG: hypothetical protein ACREMS_07090 [Gemmatimonadaceae bacterium]